MNNPCAHVRCEITASRGLAGRDMMLRCGAMVGSRAPFDPRRQTTSIICRGGEQTQRVQTQIDPNRRDLTENLNWSPWMFDAPWLSPIKAPELGATCNRLKAVRATSRAAATVIWQGSRTSAPAARPRAPAPRARACRPPYRPDRRDILQLLAPSQAL